MGHSILEGVVGDKTTRAELDSRRDPGRSFPVVLAISHGDDAESYTTSICLDSPRDIHLYAPFLNKHYKEANEAMGLMRAGNLHKLGVFAETTCITDSSTNSVLMYIGTNWDTVKPRHWQGIEAVAKYCYDIGVIRLAVYTKNAQWTEYLVRQQHVLDAWPECKVPQNKGGKEA